MNRIDDLDIIKLAHNRCERAADGAQRLAETFAAMRRHQQHAPFAEVDLRKLFIVKVIGERQRVERINYRIAGYKDRFGGDSFIEQVTASAFSGRKVKIGDAAGDTSIHLFGKGAAAIERT